MPKAAKITTPNRATLGIHPAMPARPSIVHPTRTTDLIGLTDDGRLVLWSAAAQVRPMTVHPTKGAPPANGHYVIEWKGHAITVHLSGQGGGKTCVQFMCSGSNSCVTMTRARLALLVLGVVVHDPAVEAKILRNLQALIERHADRHDIPERQRGRL